MVPTNERDQRQALSGIVRWNGRHLRRTLFLALAAVAFSLVALQTVAASGHTISSGGSVEEESIRVSDDGQWIVFLEYSGGDPSLFSAATDSSVRHLLNPPPVPGGTLFIQVRVSSDSNWVVYLGDQDSDDVWELYSVPIDGSGSAQKLNGTLVAGGDVLSDYYVTSDSQYVVYTADQVTDGVQEIFSVPIDGSAAPTKLNGSLVAGGNVWLGQPTPDGQTVIYRADQASDEVWDLYSVPIDGSSAAVRISQAGALGDAFGVWRFSPDSSRVVYLGDENTPDVWELFSVPVDGSASPATLNGTMVTNGDAWAAFAIAADSSTVVYWADQVTDEVFELFTVPIDGAAAPVKLNAPLASGGNVDGSFWLSPDSQHVVYRADQATDEVFELYSVPIDRATPPARLHAPMPAWADVAFSNALISSDSTQVVFFADADTDEQFELYAAPIAGGSPATKLSGSMPVDADVSSIVDLGPVSQRVLYRADRDTDEVLELFTVPLAGGDSIKVNEPVVPVGGDLFFGGFLPGDDTRLWYYGDATTDNVYELFISPDSGSLTCDGLPATIAGTPGDDTIVGTAGDDVIAGGDGNDSIDGGGGNDIICGDDGNDVLAGDDGADLLLGGIGSDLLKGGLGDDKLLGGAGKDRAVYLGAPSGVVVNLGIGVATGGHGDDVLGSIEHVNGTGYRDILIGDGQRNRLVGFGGDDVLRGWGGPDVVNGGSGRDVVDGGAGDDSLRGGSGIDVADFRAAPSPMIVNLATGVANGYGDDGLKFIENVWGSDFGDDLTGNWLANYLYGRGGDDTLQGMGGDDTLYGGSGTDTAHGGPGNDACFAETTTSCP